MTTQLMNLPINIPWKLIASSPDMMDVTPFNDKFPFAWRSSMAIYAYEPKLEELDEALCDQRITYLKVTTSITGYQPSLEETQEGLAKLPDVPTEDLIRIIEEAYAACYGVQLNVAVFPAPLKDAPLQDYPHIIDFEPKRRDLYQAATENGEILTASRSGVNTDKSLTSTDQTELGVNVGATVPLGDGASASAGVTPKWGHTDQDSQTFATDTSRDKREVQGTTTNLTQMYNLLTGYHAGTNRATFLMLPRPHTLQPTQFRTFTQGLRAIEGLQDHFLIVTRPKNTTGICVEASLETGHFFEDTNIQPPKMDYEYDTIEVDVKEEVTGGVFNENSLVLTNPQSDVLTYDSWEIDLTKGDGGHNGLTDNKEPDDTANRNLLSGYNYYIENDRLYVTGTITAGAWMDVFKESNVTFHHTYTVHLRRPIGVVSAEQADPTKLLITRRRLGACLHSGEECIEVIDPNPKTPLADDPFAEYRELIAALGTIDIIDETDFGFDPDILVDDRPNKLMMTRAFQQAMTTALTNSWRSQTRRRGGVTSFLDTDYFNNQIKKVLSKDKLATPLGDISGMPAEAIEQLGADCLVDDVLAMNITTLARRTELDLAGASQVRRLVLGLPLNKQ